VSFQTTPADPIIKRVETVGKVQPHVKAKLVDRKGNIVPVGTPGEICVAGYLVQKGLAILMELLTYAKVDLYFSPLSGIGKMRRNQENICGGSLAMMGRFGCILVTRVSWTTKDIYEVIDFIHCSSCS
jgi:Acyl-CoA synthetases (AMP-forming)/AMP-acid ligases II